MNESWMKIKPITPLTIQNAEIPAENYSEQQNPTTKEKVKSPTRTRTMSTYSKHSIDSSYL